MPAYGPWCSGWHNVKMIAASSDYSSLLYASVSVWWSSYGCGFEVNISSPPILEDVSHHNVAETSLREFI